ncbi:MAG: thioredoxin-dependent thiol peroxidase [Clostridia bacterium]|nr:thioredoxin-dependent thiol peroxidase [Clostridia bacterium]
MKPEIGKAAPDFDLPSNKGYNITLDSLKGKKIILYFYPKDNTPGCTKEACAFRDIFSEFTERGIEVIGISKDSIKSHDKFAVKHSLPFTLLSDTDGTTVEKYGVWVEKKLYGRKYMGIERSTFLIDENGLLEKIWENVSPDKHIGQILSHINNT